jgi:hypothetical protein
LDFVFLFTDYASACLALRLPSSLKLRRTSAMAGVGLTQIKKKDDKNLEMIEE